MAGGGDGARDYSAGGGTGGATGNRVVAVSMQGGGKLVGGAVTGGGRDGIVLPGGVGVAYSPPLDGMMAGRQLGGAEGGGPPPTLKGGTVIGGPNGLPVGQVVAPSSTRCVWVYWGAVIA